MTVCGLISLLRACAEDILELIVQATGIILIQIFSLPIQICHIIYQYLYYHHNIKNKLNTVLITGASSGIGFQFALEIALDLPTNMILISRNELNLHSIQKKCEMLGVKNVMIYACDIRNRERMKMLIEECDDLYSIDLIFANAGFRSDLDTNENATDIAYKTLDTNVMGTLNTILPIIPRYLQRKHGYIVLMSSMAGLTPHQLFPFYSASKAAILAIAENLKSNLPSFIHVTCILPGFVDTPLTEHLSNNLLPLIGSIDVVHACRKIKRDIHLHRFVCGFSSLSTILGYVSRSLLPMFKQIILEWNVIDRIIGWYEIVPNRKWN